MIDIMFNSDRFNLSAVRADFINDCCFGEDLSEWLVEHLPSAGIEADIICMEDFGWANLAVYQGASYLMCVAGHSDGNPARPDQGEWHITLQRKRGFLDKLLGRNRTAASDPIVAQVKEVLEGAGFEDVTVNA